MEEDDIYYNPESKLDNPIKEIDKKEKEEKAKNAGIELANNKKIVEKGKSIYRSQISDLIQFYHNLIRSHGEKRGYNKIHILNSLGILSRKTRLPVMCKKRTIKSLFFVDVSGSMDPEKLGKVYRIIKPLLEELGEVYYAAVDTDICSYGIVKDASFMDNLYGGGGTCFGSSIEHFAKRGFTHFIFYTDGCIRDIPFKYPENMLPEQQVWILINSSYSSYADNPETFPMPGFKIGITE